MNNFRWPARTHVGDPATSHRAEAKSRRRSKHHREIVYHLVCAYPGMHATGLTHKTAGSDFFSPDFYERRQQVRRRLSDLKLKGSLRSQSVSGQKESLWFRKEE